MRLYVLQVHENVGYDKFDDMFMFTEFSDVCHEFDNKLNYYRNKGELRSIEEPTCDEATDEVHGSFVVMINGFPVMGKVYEYDVED